MDIVAIALYKKVLPSSYGIIARGRSLNVDMGSFTVINCPVPLFSGIL